MFSTPLLSLLGFAVATTAAQRPFLQSLSNQAVSQGDVYAGVNTAGTYDSYDAGLFTPVEDLNVLSTSDFTTLSHPAFPTYNVRIKKSDFCDGTVG